MNELSSGRLSRPQADIIRFLQRNPGSFIRRRGHDVYSNCMSFDSDGEISTSRPWPRIRTNTVDSLRRRGLLYEQGGFLHSTHHLTPEGKAIEC